MEEVESSGLNKNLPGIPHDKQLQISKCINRTISSKASKSSKQLHRLSKEDIAASTSRSSFPVLMVILSCRQFSTMRSSAPPANVNSIITKISQNFEKQ